MLFSHSKFSKCVVHTQWPACNMKYPRFPVNKCFYYSTKVGGLGVTGPSGRTRNLSTNLFTFHWSFFKKKESSRDWFSWTNRIVVAGDLHSVITTASRVMEMMADVDTRIVRAANNKRGVTTLAYDCHLIFKFFSAVALFTGDMPLEPQRCWGCFTSWKNQCPPPLLLTGSASSHSRFHLASAISVVPHRLIPH